VAIAVLCPPALARAFPTDLRTPGSIIGKVGNSKKIS
jgi:hypothetical protein